MTLRSQFVESASARLSQFLIRRQMKRKDLNTELLFAIDHWLTGISDHSTLSLFSEIEALRQQILSDHSPLFIEGFSEAERRWIFEASHWGRSSHWSILIYFLTHHLKRKCCLEIGTCLGFSAAYMASGVAKNGQVHSFEINTVLSKAAQKVLAALKQNVEVHNQSSVIDLEQFLDRHPDVDFVFIDGDHRKDSTLECIEVMCRKLKNDTVLVLDDIRWSDEMSEVWRIFQKMPQVSDCVDLQQMGIGIIRSSRPKKGNLRLPLFLH